MITGNKYIIVSRNETVSTTLRTDTEIGIRDSFKVLSTSCCIKGATQYRNIKYKEK